MFFLIQTIKNLLLQIRFLIFYNTSGMSDNTPGLLNKPRAVDVLAFQTVAIAKYLNKPRPLNSDTLATYELILYMMYVLRLECMSKITSAEQADKFSKAYVHKVLNYCKNKENLNRKYKHDIFLERINFYNSLFDKNASTEKNIENLYFAFCHIIGSTKSFYTFDNFEIGKSPFIFQHYPVHYDYDDEILDSAVWARSFSDYFYKSISDVVEEFKEIRRGRSIYDSEYFNQR